MESLELRAVSRIYTDAHGAPFRALDAVSLSWRQGDAIRSWVKAVAEKARWHAWR